MTEPGRKSAGAVVDFGTAGGCLGALVGVAVAVIGSVTLGKWLGNPPGTCEAASRHALVVLAILAACGVVAWLTMFRPRRQTKVGAIGGWFAIWLAVSLAIPWPHSYSFMVIAGLSTCGAQ